MLRRACRQPCAFPGSRAGRVLWERVAGRWERTRRGHAQSNHDTQGGACCRREEQQARVHRLVRACTAMPVLLGDTYHRKIKCQALCSSWGGRCSRPARWGRPAAALRLQHPAQAGAEASVRWWPPRARSLACSLSRFAKRSPRQAAKLRAPSRSCAVPPRHPTCFPATSKHSHHQFTAEPSAPAGMLPRQRPSQLD